MWYSVTKWGPVCHCSVQECGKKAKRRQYYILAYRAAMAVSNRAIPPKTEAVTSSDHFS